MPLSILAQKDVVTFGMQLRPLIPNSFVDFGPVTKEAEGLEATWNPKLSLNFGMIIRYGFTDNFSFETGINWVRRNYLVTMKEESEVVQADMRFGLIGYEIPIQGLYYVRLGEELWMNASGGISLDMYPSSTYSTTSVQRDAVFFDFEQWTARNAWVQLAVQANYGFEWRTKDNGYYYIGATYHQPFNDMAITEAQVSWEQEIKDVFGTLSGNYFTVDLRYFFHEDPERRKKMKKAPR